MHVTMQDIARRMGLSRPTVSLALAGKGTVSPETRDAIRKVALELGYRPNSLARATRQGRTNMVGLLLSTQLRRSDLPTGLFNGIDDALSAHGLHMTISRMPDEQLVNEGFVPRILKELMSDGLLINYNANIPQKMIDLIEAHSLPSIWLNCQRDHDAIRPDDFGAGELAVRTLIERGHRRIAYVDYVYHLVQKYRDFHYSRSQRFEGYVHAMRQAGLQPVMISDETDPASSVDIMDQYRTIPPRLCQVLRDDHAPTALICYGNGALIREAAAAVGRHIPRDLSLLLFRSANEFIEPLLTRDSGIIIPQYQLGNISVEMLLRKIEAPQTPLATRVIPFYFQEGESL